MKKFLLILIISCFMFYGSWYLFEFVNPWYGLFGVALTFGIIIDQIHKSLKN